MCIKCVVVVGVVVITNVSLLSAAVRVNILIVGTDSHSALQRFELSTRVRILECVETVFLSCLAKRV